MRVYDMEEEDKTESEIKLDELFVRVQKHSRLPIMDGDRIKYIIHDSMIFRYVAEHATKPAAEPEPTAEDGAPAEPRVDLSQISLAEFLDDKIGDDETGEQQIRAIVTKFVVVSETASLAEVRDRMVALVGAKDAIVTRTGGEDEPVIGWITDTDIAREADVIR